MATKITLIFGSIGTLMETSDIQRRAYNQALSEAGLSWIWTPEIYSDLLNQSGGQDRLTLLAQATATPLTPLQIEQIHSRKTQLACQELESSSHPLRPGVEKLIEFAKSRSMKLAIVTTTFQENIDAIFKASSGALQASDFLYIGDRLAVTKGKPSPEAYLIALAKLETHPDTTLAIEDTAASVMSAKRATITVIATPGERSYGLDLWQADLVCSSLLDSTATIDERVLSFLG
jgi:HAD superfamily hydrolase (TIGR01509 family)